jgi:hypothetical protein
MAATDRAIERQIASLSPLMSDAKWRRVLNFLDGDDRIKKPIRWKFVGADRIYESRIGVVEDRYCDALFGVAPFKHIEWIEVASSACEAIQNDLSLRGKFDLERTADGFKLYGYR